MKKQKSGNENPQPDLTSLHKELIAGYQSLSEGFRPEEIRCRNEEKEEIRTYIKMGLKEEGKNQSLYISGVPGIGKTLCVKEIMDELQNQKDGSSQFIYLNAMQLKHPKDIFKALYAKLTGKITTSNSAFYLLDDWLRKGKADSFELFALKKVVVIDEIDYLDTKSQQILYTIFDWTQYEKSKLIIICISNTIDFPETLSQKILSRIGNQRLIFKPYSSPQLQEILNQRISHLTVFDEKAVQYICKKISRSSSDIRKCLRVLREAIDLQIRKKEQSKICISTLIEAHETVYDDPFNMFYENFPLPYRRILACLSHHFRYERYAISFRELRNKIKTHFSMEIRDINEVLNRLRDMELVKIKYSSQVDLMARGRKMKHLKEPMISLQIDAQKIVYATSKDNDLLLMN